MLYIFVTLEVSNAFKSKFSILEHPKKVDLNSLTLLVLKLLKVIELTFEKCLKKSFIFGFK